MSREEMGKNKVEIVIFDLDGTLINAVENLTYHLNKVLDEKNYPRRSVEEVKLLVGNGVGTLINKAVPQGTSATDIERCLKKFMEIYNEDMYSNNTVYEGIVETLTELKSKGLKTAVVSNKPNSETKAVCRHYFGDLIDIAYGESFGRNKKPEPDGVLEAIEYLNGSLENSIYVGDTKVDVETGRNVGIPVLGALWGYRSREELEKAGASVIISHPSEILNYIDSFK